MGEQTIATIDGNEAVADVAYRLNEVIAIYPITPASPMGEWADAWAAEGRRNLWGTVPSVVEMQSEGGAAGLLHGALQTGSLSTTFTASQGLLLMVPNMYKIAGELTPTVFHVAARAVATQALSIFGDHSDVMATRATGFAMLASSNVQEAMDGALIAQAASLETCIPFLHFFDGFRTSHEIGKVEMLSDATMRSMIDPKCIADHRRRALSPEHPVLRGTAQNPDVFFQSRETVNPHYLACPAKVQRAFDRFAQLTGRQYRLFEYHGAPDATHILVLIGSGAETAHETIDYLVARGEKVGMIKVRLYRPFDVATFVAALPATTEAIAVLDRTKEPGGVGEPLYTDCIAALHEVAASGWGTLKPDPIIVGGRYGLASKEFTPAMVKSIFDNLRRPTPRNHFTIGINDDVSHTSLCPEPEFCTEPDDVVRAVFYGIGADGTVGANKNSIKIIGELTPLYAQGYFVYDSKKSGARTVSHLRFGPRPIRSTYLIARPNFVACHQPNFLGRYDMLKGITQGGTFLLNTPADAAEVWPRLPVSVQAQIIAGGLNFYVVDAEKVARASGLNGQINTVMQVCFFALANVLPCDAALAAIKAAIQKTYGKKGEEIVTRNLAAVESALAHLEQVDVPAETVAGFDPPLAVTPGAPVFVRDVLAKIIADQGDSVPVSALPCDGTYPTGTAQWEKRNLAQEIPVWDADLCIQCGKCAMVCPHAVIRIKTYDDEPLSAAPPTFKVADAKDKEWHGQKYTIQVAPEDCTGCGLCVDVCPAKNKSRARVKALMMRPQAPLREAEKANWEFFQGLPQVDRSLIKVGNIRQQQLQEPLFEFSGACGGCGETPYLKLLTQLFGDRALIANATGCSSIFGGNLPTTPWAMNAEGRGPAWSNSLFEDNAEFGMGFRVSLDKQREQACELVQQLRGEVGDALADELLHAPQEDEADIYEQRARVATLKALLPHLASEAAQRLLPLADAMVQKSVWIVGGDGWAYDIGYGGLDHVLASGRNVNILVLDTEVYSNTGGQMSKSTPRGAVAKFAAAGKAAGKKDLGLHAMTYGNVYVGCVAMGARDEHTLRTFLEAEAYKGPSLIIAYSHCIAHGIDMSAGLRHQKAAVDAGQLIIYRFDPRREETGENPLQLDSHGPKIPIEQYLYLENRFKMLTKSQPDRARRLLSEAQRDVDSRWSLYQYLASRKVNGTKDHSAPPTNGAPPTNDAPAANGAPVVNGAIRHVAGQQDGALEKVM